MKDVRDKLILSTIALGAKQGIEGINMKTLSQKCKVSVGTMYYHFKDKYDLLYNATFYVVKQLTVEINKAINAGAPYEENYKNILRAIVEYDIAHPEEAIFYCRTLVVPSIKFKKRDNDEVVDYCPLTAFLRKGGEAGIIVNYDMIMTLAYFPLCTYLLHCFMGKIEPNQTDIENIIDRLWLAISL